jgi:hypothetical protein
VTEFPSDLNVTKYTPEERLETSIVFSIVFEDLKICLPEISVTDTLSIIMSFLT